MMQLVEVERNGGEGFVRGGFGGERDWWMQDALLLSPHRRSLRVTLGTASGVM